MLDHLPHNVRFLICFTGVFFGYLCYGLLQEKITRSKYTYEGKEETFQYTQALVVTMCILNATVAYIMLKVLSPKEDPTSKPLYAVCSMSYVGAMLASNKALQYVPYPTQVLGKSIKPIPVMLMGVLLIRKRYSTAKYCCVLLIVAGVALFMYKDKPAKQAAQTSDGLFGLGEILLLTSLLLDGVTGTIQDKIRSAHKISPYSMMLHVNAWSVLWLAIGLVASGELFTFLGFMDRHPYVLPILLAAGAASAVGQIFIFLTITTFGPLTCSIITTTRKFFTILGSVIVFGNPMVSRQWLGTVLVFAGLGLDSRYGKSKHGAVTATPDGSEAKDAVNGRAGEPVLTVGSSPSKGKRLRKD